MDKLAVNFSCRLTDRQRQFLDEKARKEGRRSAGNALRHIIDQEIERKEHGRGKDTVGKAG
ncbi:MAG: hypothetical protein ABIH46_08350 [Chloroflexota bacterium]